MLLEAIQDAGFHFSEPPPSAHSSWTYALSSVVGIIVLVHFLIQGAKAIFKRSTNAIEAKASSTRTYLITIFLLLLAGAHGILLDIHDLLKVWSHEGMPAPEAITGDLHRGVLALAYSLKVAIFILIIALIRHLLFSRQKPKNSSPA